MAITSKTRKKLWAKSGNICSFPDCDLELCVEDSSNNDLTLGEECHVVAKKSDGARGNSDMSSPERDKYKNLILLCSNHHTLIDNDEEEYTVERLHAIKTTHENWVQDNLKKAVRKKNDFYFEDEAEMHFDDDYLNEVNDWILNNTDYDHMTVNLLKESISNLMFLGEGTRKMLVRIINYNKKKNKIDIPSLYKKLIEDEICDENEFFEHIRELEVHQFLEFDDRFKHFEDENGNVILCSSGTIMAYMNQICDFGDYGIGFDSIEKFLRNKTLFKSLVVDEVYEML